jgi:hypothetical protein
MFSVSVTRTVWKRVFFHVLSPVLSSIHPPFAHSYLPFILFFLPSSLPYSLLCLSFLPPPLPYLYLASLSNIDVTAPCNVTHSVLSARHIVATYYERAEHRNTR